MKRFVLALLLMTVVLTLVGCSTKTTIPITLNEKFYDTKSVKDGQLSGVIRYLIFTSESTGELHYYSKVSGATEWQITHYKQKFIYTIIDEESVFLTFDRNDVKYFDDHTLNVITPPLTTLLLMVSKNLVYTSEGTHYLRYDYLKKHDYLIDDSISPIIVQDISIFKTSLVESGQFIIKNQNDLDAYKAQNYPIPNYYLTGPYGYFEKQGVYVIFHITTPNNKAYEFDSYSYRNRKLEIVLRETTDNTPEQTSFVIVNCYVFDNLESVSYTIKP